MGFIKNNKLFTFLYIVSALVAFGLVYQLGFGESVRQIASAPERLRDITFYIWDNYSANDHGFLVYYSLDNFEKKIAYSNHPTAYLLCMYILYKIEMLFPSLQMRLTGAFLDMMLLVGMLFFIVSRLSKDRINLTVGILVILSMLFMATMPGFWISVARFNVDNPFPMIFAFNVLLSFYLCYFPNRKKLILLGTLLFAMFSPMYSVVFGMALLLCGIQRDGFDNKLLRLSFLAVFTGVVFYLQPLWVSKSLGFSSSNSGWFFRAGLDGDTSYFTNVWWSVVLPYYPRPVHIIALPIIIFLVQSLYFKIRDFLTSRKIGGEESLIPGSGTFVYLIFTPYLFTCLLWPQSVSIHPYLYDFLLVAPAALLIAINFLRMNPEPNLKFWLLVMLFCLSFNLQQVSQAKCIDCRYPSWNMKNN